MKEKIKLVIVFVLGIMISVVISVYAATVISAGEVSYTDNKGIGASNVQDAINGVYTEANDLATNVTTLKTKLENTSTLSSGYYTMPNGLTIAWGTKSITKNINSAWGNIYGCGDFDPGITFPVTFSTIYNVQVTSGSDNGSFWIGDVRYSTTKIWNIQFFRGTTSTSTVAPVHWFAIGKV